MNIQEIRSQYPQYNDLSDDQLLKGFHGKFYSDMPYEEFAAKVGQPPKVIQHDTAKVPEQKRGFLSLLKPEIPIGDIAAGAVRGAGSIGATILRPFDSGEENKQRRQAMTEALASLGADTESGAFAAGKIGGEIAGTAGIPGLLGKGAAAVPYLSKLAPAINSGGFSLGNAATGSNLANAALRTAGGAIAGGATAGAIDPSQADTGMIIGAAAPGAVKAAGLLGKGLGKVGDVVASNLLGSTTGTGAEAIRGAFKAGKNKNAEFVEHLRGQGSFDDVVERAREGLQRMRISRSDAYRSGMVDIKNDKSILDLAPITSAMKKVGEMGSFKGQQINKNAAGTVQELDDIVNTWAKLDPKEFHTPEGLDALKQAVGDIRDTTQAGTAARRAVDQVYNAVKNQIIIQAPTYSKVMKDYSSASEMLREIGKTLSLGDKTSKDTAIRKLQSLTRNNAQTNYGNRLGLAKVLEDEGGVSLMPAISGQAMNTWLPRGILGAMEKVAIPGAALLNPAALAMAPFASPRLMGEAAYGLGRVTGAWEDVLTKIAQPSLAGQFGLLDATAANPFLRSLLFSSISANP